MLFFYYAYFLPINYMLWMLNMLIKPYTITPLERVVAKAYIYVRVGQ